MNGKLTDSDDASIPVVPQHVAIIMDGNGRWAKSKNLPRVEGHRNGAKTVRNIVEESRRLGIRYLTLFAFSSENWGRPAAEVDALMALFAQYLESEIPTLTKNGIRLRCIGDRTKLPASVCDSLNRCETKSENQTGMDLILAISYGSRDEITNAVQSIARQIADGKLKPEDISVNTVSAALYAPDVPDPDLLIRTSDENRISNFLLWQLAYSEIVVSPVLWPDFSISEYKRCLTEFGGRKRRFGLTEEQIEVKGVPA